MLSISVIPVGVGGREGVKDLSLGSALIQSPSPKITWEVAAEPPLKAKSLDPQEGALSTPSSFSALFPL